MPEAGTSATSDGRGLLCRLVQHCAVLANLAGATIRAVQREREEAGEASLGASLKNPEDPRSFLTIADLRAQKVIVEGLRREFPGIVLVGEEDDNDNSAGAALCDDATWWPETGDAAGRAGQPAPSSANLPTEYVALALEDLVVFIDPLDGTREFVEKRLESVQTLIGISWRGRPIAGVVGLPFHHPGRAGLLSETPSSNADGIILHGIVGMGVLGLLEMQSSSATRSHLVCAASKSVKEPVLQQAHTIIGGELLVAGGCGNKVLQLLLAQADVAVFNLGTSLWDTCATEALLVASGGTMTTLLGTPIEHRAGVPTLNRLGVVATARSFERVSGRTHNQLCNVLRQDLNNLLAALIGGGLVAGCDGSEQQALDVIRTIDGQPLTADSLGEIVGHPRGIAAFHCPESECVRYKQSVAARIYLTRRHVSLGRQEDSVQRHKKDQPAESPESSVPASIFIKRAVPRELPYAMSKHAKYPFKTLRDVHANRIEAAFLGSALTRTFCEAAGVRIALPYRVEQRSYQQGQNPIDSRFTLFLYDFSPQGSWYQAAHLAGPELKASLCALAQWHAFFWQSHDPQGEKRRLASELWDVGSYWHLGQQPDNQIASLCPNWARLQKEFDFPVQWCLGERLQRLADLASRETHGLDSAKQKLAAGSWSGAPYKTVIHGDPKASNLFFKRKRTAPDEAPLVGLIDMQWCGTGIGATDVAYCIAASAHPDLFSGSAAVRVEEQAFSNAGSHMAVTVVDSLVRVYHQSLLAALVSHGVTGDLGEAAALLPEQTLQVQVEWAWIDLARVVIGEHWSSVTKEVLTERQGHMSFNAYNKSLTMAHRIMQITDEYLRRREAALSVS